MIRSCSFLSIAAIFVASVALAATSAVRVRVALLDGAPVYHWRVFKSVYSNDLDRALVLRESKRQVFAVPEQFVDEELELVIAENFHDDKTAFEEGLKRSGASIAEFKQFLAEELTLVAFPKFVARHSKAPDSPAARAKWIASLRKSARITSLHIAPSRVVTADTFEGLSAIIDYDVKHKR